MDEIKSEIYYFSIGIKRKCNQNLTTFFICIYIITQLVHKLVLL